MVLTGSLGLAFNTPPLHQLVVWLSACCRVSLETVEQELTVGTKRRRGCGECERRELSDGAWPNRLGTAERQGRG